MKNQSDHELLSAYLDGELDAAERARAERLLADNPSAGQLLDELRALGSTLQSLPRHELGEDLSETVLQSAARRKANEIDAPRPVPAPAEPGRFRPRALGRKIADRIKDNPRMVVWPLIVLTVAALLMVFDPDRRDPGRGGGDRNIAMLPQDGKSAGKAEGADRAAGAKIIAPKEGEYVKPEDRPSMSAVKSPDVVPNPSQLVAKGGGDAAETPDRPSAASLAGLVVIQCQASREALEKREYRKVFDENDIALSEQPVGEVLRMTPAELASAAGVDVAELDVGPHAADAKPKATILLVEVAPGQIAKILDGLKAMPDKFHEVSIRTPRTPPSHSPAPPLPGAKAPAAKRVLVVFRVLDAALPMPAGK
ncbi:MAG: zf-HC2 domain-containing protein [Pirellulales bacterium]|nr:zf-HC2 domain-containing protein [Pirellulales bacterium]